MPISYRKNPSTQIGTVFGGVCAEKKTIFCSKPSKKESKHLFWRFSKICLRRRKVCLDSNLVSSKNHFADLKKKFLSVFETLHKKIFEIQTVKRPLMIDKATMDIKSQFKVSSLMTS